jgi:hypothetical protein
MNMKWTDPRERLPPEAKRFLSAARQHFGPDAVRNVFVYPAPTRQGIANADDSDEFVNGRRSAE